MTGYNVPLNWVGPGGEGGDAEAAWILADQALGRATMADGKGTEALGMIDEDRSTNASRFASLEEAAAALDAAIANAENTHAQMVADREAGDQGNADAIYDESQSRATADAMHAAAISQLRADLANIQLTPGPKGDAGESGTNGTNGVNGQEVEIRKTTTHIQWRLGAGTWNNLVSLLELTGAAGSNGTNGQEVSLQASSTYIQWRLGGGSWQNLVALSSLKGDTGATGPAGVAAMALGTGRIAVALILGGSVDVTVQLSRSMPSTSYNVEVPLTNGFSFGTPKNKTTTSVTIPVTAGLALAVGASFQVLAWQ